MARGFNRVWSFPDGTMIHIDPTKHLTAYNVNSQLAQRAYLVSLLQDGDKTDQERDRSGRNFSLKLDPVHMITIKNGSLTFGNKHGDDMQSYDVSPAAGFDGGKCYENDPVILESGSEFISMTKSTPVTCEFLPKK